MSNIKGTIEIAKVDLLGYTPDTQDYIVRNANTHCVPGGSVAVFEFLQAHRKHFSYTSFGHVLNVKRIAKFTKYAESQGFEVREAGR